MMSTMPNTIMFYFESSRIVLDVDVMVNIMVLSLTFLKMEIRHSITNLF